MVIASASRLSVLLPRSGTARCFNDSGSASGVLGLQAVIVERSS